MKNKSQFFKSISQWRWYFKNLSQLKKGLNGNKDFPITTLFPILNERFDAGGGGLIRRGIVRWRR